MVAVYKSLLDKAERRPFKVTVIVALFILLPPCFLRITHMPDEGRYAEVSRETLVTQNGLVPHINGVPHLTKPPLYYNLGAAFLFLFGIHIFSIRLLSLCAFLIGLFWCVRWAMKRGGGKASLLGGMIGATIFQSAAQAQFADLNMLFSFWLMGGLLLFFDALERPENKASWCGAWIFFALAFLTKGPPALMIPLITIILFRLVSGRKFALPLSRWILGIALFCLIAFPWYIWIFLHERERLTHFWFDNIFRKTVLGEEKGSHYPGYYIPVFLIGGAGWSFLSLSELISNFKSRRKDLKSAHPSGGSPQKDHGKRIVDSIRRMPHDQLWLLCWILATIIPFSLILAGMISYILPCYPAFALYLALYFARKGEGFEQKKIRRTFLFSIVFFILVVWSWSLYGYVSVHSRSPRLLSLFPKRLEPSWINRRIRSFGKESYLLIQFDYFTPIFNFENQRNSVLVWESVNSQWPPPPNLRYAIEELQHHVRNNRPIALIVQPHNYQFISGEGWENLHVYFRGEHFILLVTDSLGAH
ncbi:glycosyltransferase family 39 protein [Candidatus Sumerlaeota bacterium]|nr:glycosyltransferase family 39 protein [Candidatus Sumerlaeota bacterium]